MLKDTDGDGYSDSEDEKPIDWNVSDRDMFMFSQLAYRDTESINSLLAFSKDPSFKPFEGNEKYNIMRNELAPFWKLEKFYNDKSGL